jgi:hypothetical protein
MRQATLTLNLILVGCAGDLPVSVDDGEIDADGVPTHNPDNCPGGGGGEIEPGGGGSGEIIIDKKPIPAPRDCTRETDWILCYDCCDWNSKNVWERTCNRLKGDAKRECWWRLENEWRPNCYKACNRPGGPITTVAP